MRLQNVKAVLLDLDGTLVNSSEAIINAVEKVLESRGLTCNRADVAGMIGLPLEDVFGVIASNLSDEEIWQLVHEYREYYKAHHLENTSIHHSAQMPLKSASLWATVPSMFMLESKQAHSQSQCYPTHTPESSWKTQIRLL